MRYPTVLILVTGLPVTHLNPMCFDILCRSNNCCIQMLERNTKNLQPTLCRFQTLLAMCILLFNYVTQLLYLVIYVKFQFHVTLFVISPFKQIHIVCVQLFTIPNCLFYRDLWLLLICSGHGSFSSNPKLNSAVGHLLHSSILVPYHGWYSVIYSFPYVSLCVQCNLRGFYALVD